MKYKIILLRDVCPALEQAVNEKLSKNPSFFKNISQHTDLYNNKLTIKDGWQVLTFLAIRDKADIHNFKYTDILCYCNLCISKSANTINNVSLISFCDRMRLLCSIFGTVLERVYEIYEIPTISFSAKEGDTTHRLFELIMSNQKITNTYFKNWIGRYVGYTTLSSTDQSNTNYNEHIFELIRKQDS